MDTEVLASQEHELLSPLEDLVFKAIFGKLENLDLLSNFIKAVLDFPDDAFDHLEIETGEYDELTITDPNLRIDYRGDKLGILDVKVFTKSGKRINVEMQVQPMPALRERIVFYNSKMITEQARSHDAYKTIKKVISIVILGYTLIKENDCYHNVFQLYDKNTGTKFTDIMEIHTLELAKLPKQDANERLINWLQFFKATKKEEFLMLAKVNDELKKAYEALESLSQDGMTREEYEWRLRARRDQVSILEGMLEQGLERGLEQGREQGREQGLEQGKQQALLHVAKNMLAADIPLETIVKTTGLAETEIKALKGGE